MAGIFVRGKTIWITYSINGNRYRESLGIEASRENMKLARRVKALKEAEIINGVHREVKKVRPKLLMDLRIANKQMDKETHSKICGDNGKLRYN